MEVKFFTVNMFGENTYICHCHGEGVLIDPGSSNDKERQDILDYIAAHNLTIKHLLLTHGHIDHIIDCAFFSRHFGMNFKMHQKDVQLLENAHVQSEMFGVRFEKPEIPEEFLDESDTITFGETTWSILYCPGHSPGSICFYDENDQSLIAGDVLFQGSVGRTDLWEGSMEVLLESINGKLMKLPDEVKVYPGHGPPTTIGAERESNPFL